MQYTCLLPRLLPGTHSSLPQRTGLGWVVVQVSSDDDNGTCDVNYWSSNHYLRHPHSFVCLSLCTVTQKRRAWIWMKSCVSTDVGTWTNWLTFKPDPDYSPDAGTGLLSPISYKRCNAKFCYVGKILSIRIGHPSLTHDFKMVLCTARHWNTFVRGTCALLRALLVWTTSTLSQYTIVYQRIHIKYASYTWLVLQTTWRLSPWH